MVFINKHPNPAFQTYDYARLLKAESVSVLVVIERRIASWPKAT